MPKGDRRVYSSSEPGAVQPARTPKPKRNPRPGSVPETAGIKGDTVYIERSRKGRGGKTVTLVINAPGDEHSKRALLKELKAACGAGGTIKDGVIEIQGDQRDRLLLALAGRGWTVKPRGG